MSNITKEQVLNNLEEVKKYIAEVESKKEEKVVGIRIETRLGNLIFQSTKATMKEAVLERLASSTNLRDANLRNANLSGADLCDADLCGADLRDANLRDANLYGADLSDADLCGADLRNANLSGADLCGAELAYAKFYGRGGTKVIKKENLAGFLGALGFVLED
jgi:uncharacterized protein YjbI with pentapeptide repeats